MILARCPACQTVFRVRPEQLRAHHGQVRCGHCYSPFNALEHLLEELPADAAAQSDDPGTTTAPPAPASVPPASVPPASVPPASVPPAAVPPAAVPSAAVPPAAAQRTDVEERPDASPNAPAQAGRFFVLEERQAAPAPREPSRGFLPFEPADRNGAPEAPAEPAASEGVETEGIPAAGPAPQVQPAAPSLDWSEPPPPQGRNAPGRSGSTFDDLADRLEFGLPDSFLTASKTRVDEPFVPPSAPDVPPGPVPSKPDTHEQPDCVELPDFPEIFVQEPEPALPGASGREREPESDPLSAPTIMPEFDEPASSVTLHGDAVPQTPYIADEAPTPEQLDAAYGPLPSARSGRRWLWSVGIGILLGALAVQAAYVFREDIARQWPQLRPVYVMLCERLGCSMPLPRVADAISIENSDLQSDPARPGSFLLNALIRNRADHVQALPHLELTLTDARDRPVVRRVFAPEEWVPHGDPGRGFLGGEELAVHLAFAAPGVAASCYRVYVFYP